MSFSAVALSWLCLWWQCFHNGTYLWRLCMLPQSMLLLRLVYFHNDANQHGASNDYTCDGNGLPAHTSSTAINIEGVGITTCIHKNGASWYARRASVYICKRMIICVLTVGFDLCSADKYYIIIYVRTYIQYKLNCDCRSCCSFALSITCTLWLPLCNELWNW